MSDVRTVNLSSYLPDFIAEIKEIDNIMCAENSEFDVFYTKSRDILNNAFILTCDERGIKRYEDLVGVKPGADDTLKQRIDRVLAFWWIDNVYTLSYLKQKLKEICKGYNFAISINYDEYRIDVAISSRHYKDVENLEKLLKIIIPANMSWRVYNDLINQGDGCMFIGGIT